MYSPASSSRASNLKKVVSNSSPIPPTPPHLVRFTKYQLLSELGSGAFGTVFKASIVVANDDPTTTSLSSSPRLRKRKVSGTLISKSESVNAKVASTCGLDASEFRAIKQVPCNAPESVELALHEFWALSALSQHDNVVHFEECYLQTDDKTVPMKSLRKLNPSKTTSKVCQAYLQLLEASLKGECMSYCTVKGQRMAPGPMKKPKLDYIPLTYSQTHPVKKLRSASVGSPAIPKVSTWAPQIKPLHNNVNNVLFPSANLSSNQSSTLESSVKRMLPRNSSSNYFLWFVMEFCDGGDLNTYLLKTHRPKSQTTRASLNAQFVLDLANGVRFLHDHNVVHRDLKPENVLVSLSTNRPCLKIADFGLSKLCAKNDGVENTILQSACGSDFFMSSEVYQGNYTAKADVFALGCMAYSICTDLTFVEGGKELYGVFIMSNSVKRAPAPSSPRSKKNRTDFDSPRMFTGPKVQSSPARGWGRKLSDGQICPRFDKSLVVAETTDDTDDTISTQSDDRREFIPLGEAQLIDCGLSLDSLPVGKPCVKANWSKLKKFLLNMITRNPSERPSATEVATTLYTTMDIRLTRRSRQAVFAKPKLQTH